MRKIDSRTLSNPDLVIISGEPSTTEKIVKPTKAKETIKISRKGHTYRNKGALAFPGHSKMRHISIDDYTTAIIISEHLAKIQYQNASTYQDARWHIIHIPTGLVIADVTTNLISMVKKTFEESKWTLRGDNTLVLVDEFPFEMTCHIRYTIHDEQTV